LTRPISGFNRLIQTSGLLLCIVLGGAGAYAQVDSGTVTGTVKNPAGEGAAGAKVFLKNEATSITRSTYTRGDGTYIFTPVKIGVYSISVELQGFVPDFQAGVVVEIQQQVVVNFNLVATQAGSGAVVTSGSTAFYTYEPADKVVTPQGVRDLPIFTRNFTFLAQLFPGTMPGVPTSNAPATTVLAQMPTSGGRSTPQLYTGLERTGTFAANGTQPYQNSYLLDGADNNNYIPDFLPGNQYVVLPPMEGIEELRVQTPYYGAAVGRLAGAAVNATTKSGANEFHGSAWDYYSNDYTNAADFFDNAVALRKAELRRN